MAENRLRDAVKDGEALRFEAPIRTGGRLGVTDDRVLFVRNNSIEDVPLENVKEVTIQTIDWFLVVLSIALAAVGGYGVLVIGDPILGSAFIVAAAVNLYVTYRKRGQLGLRLHSGRKPIEAYIDDTDDVESALRRAIESYDIGSDD